MTIAAIAFFVLLGLGLPVGFVMLGASMAYFAQNPMMASIVAQRMSSGLESFPLLAIPLFVVAGAAMARGGIAERLYGFCDTLVGHWRGGLAQIAVLNSVFMGAMSGSANADAAIDARTIVPVMRKHGYSNAYGSVISAASSLIAPVMPPSIALIVYGLLTNTSIGKLFLGGVVPALLIALALMLTVRWTAAQQNLPASRTTRATAREVLSHGKAAIWAIAMPVMLIFGLRGGWFTPTELGAVAAVYAYLVGAVLYRRISMRDTFDLLSESAATTAGVMFIVASASVFSLILSLEQVPQAMIGALTAISDNKYVVLVIINIALLLLGTVFEGLAIIVILGPMLLQLGKTLEVDPVHLGVILVLNTAIGSLTPPVGTVMFTVCSITRCSIEDFSLAFVPFLLALLGVLFLLTFVPGLVTFLPDLVF
ncbi:TRAP transporter large permease [Pseudotabrizicola alkalilacus]|uniref:TRAP transporter large permease protein n=1 Tax=Pseudotabrizicola alkalilacus TaxID=2305252 RepID=A0A411YWQ7_9RHOB|nr:TRAP transporter large permease [Pseudotabrizicola alkalilacus]RGP35276.1 TRAP transporter large permease [Pseudotabrizicola alkalilacus]